MRFFPIPKHLSSSSLPLPRLVFPYHILVHILQNTAAAPCSPIHPPLGPINLLLFLLSFLYLLDKILAPPFPHTNILFLPLFLFISPHRVLILLLPPPSLPILFSIIHPLPILFFHPPPSSSSSFVVFSYLIFYLLQFAPFPLLPHLLLRSLPPPSSSSGYQLSACSTSSSPIAASLFLFTLPFSVPPSMRANMAAVLFVVVGDCAVNVDTLGAFALRCSRRHTAAAAASIAVSAVTAQLRSLPQSLSETMATSLPLPSPSLALLVLLASRKLFEAHLLNK